MRRVRIDGTGLEVSRFALGTASLHRVPARSEREALLQAAFDAGFRHFDTSPYYGYGLAEAAMGQALRSRRADLTIATKIGLYPRVGAARSLPLVWSLKVAGRVWPSLSRPVVDWSVRRAGRSLQESLARLGTNYVDILFLHEPHRALIAADEFRAWLEKLQRAGTIGCWGVAGEPEVVAPWLAVDSPLAQVVQIRDSLDMREADAVRDAQRPLQFTYGYFSAAKKAGVTPSREILQRILERNTTGSIVVSTLRKERLRDFAEAAT